MERSVRVATGENVAFDYELAGVGSRFIAVTLDFAIQIVVTFVLALLVSWLASTFEAFGGALSSIGQSIAQALLSLVLFAIFFGYFILFEWLWEGRTPGKRLLRIRVVRDGGFPIDVTASVVRNVIRVLEFAFGYYVVSGIVSVLSPTNRRFGDYAAGTIVVREDRLVRGARLPEYGVDDPAIADLTDRERDLAISYAARRDGFGTNARTKLAAQLAAPLRGRVPGAPVELDDDGLLRYVARLASASRAKDG